MFIGDTSKEESEARLRCDEGEARGGKLKLGQAPRLRCSEAVLDGFDAENAASQRVHFSFTDFGWLVSGFVIKIGSK